MTDAADALAILEAALEGAAPAELPGLLGQLEAVRAVGWARLVTPVVARKPEPADELLDIDGAAALTGRSASWLRKRGRELPGFVQPGGPGTRARWSRRALTAWAYAP